MRCAMETQPIARARQALSVATPPGAMPGRETERADIIAFVEGAVSAGVHAGAVVPRLCI